MNSLMVYYSPWAPKGQQLRPKLKNSLAFSNHAGKVMSSQELTHGMMIRSQFSESHQNIEQRRLSDYGMTIISGGLRLIMMEIRINCGGSLGG